MLTRLKTERNEKKKKAADKHIKRKGIPTYGPPITEIYKAVFTAHSSLLPYCPTRMVKRRNGCSSTISGVSSDVKKE
jgi:hypothetical protein